MTCRASTSRPGRRVLLLIGSANRDEDVFADPERYDLDRNTQNLISFGGGRHFCMGAALARMEARIALDELVRRVADYDIDAAGLRAGPLHQRAGLRRAADDRDALR